MTVEPEAGGVGPGAAPGMITRIGLALVAPRWALAIADHPEHTGRSGNDLIRMLGVLLLSVHTRRLVAAVWLAVAVGFTAGLRGAAAVLSQALTVDLAFLVIATVVLWLAAGPRRGLGRAFDQVCVAAIPLIAIEVVATTIVRAADLAVPPTLGLVLSGIAFGWAGALVALAWRQVRRSPPKASRGGAAPPVIGTEAPASQAATPLPPEIARRGTRVGAALLALAAALLVINTVWVVRNADLLRPMTPGEPAPGFALPAIEAGGALGPRVGLDGTRGKVVVIDFWATWCGPCIDAMPHLARIRDQLGADGEVILVNLDDPVAARALIDRIAPKLTLVFDDQEVARRYGVDPLPHTVVVDRAGRVSAVFRGGGGDLAGAVARARD